MASTLHEKIKKLGRARQEKIQARADQLIAEERSLRELREAHRLTQQEIGEILGIGQHGVSRLEKRTDLLLSTLREYIEGMGGRLSLIAEFPNQQPVIVSGFTDLDGSRSSHKDKKAVHS